MLLMPLPNIWNHFVRIKLVWRLELYINQLQGLLLHSLAHFAIQIVGKFKIIIALNQNRSPSIIAEGSSSCVHIIFGYSKSTDMSGKKWLANRMTYSKVGVDHPSGTPPASTLLINCAHKVVITITDHGN